MTRTRDEQSGSEWHSITNVGYRPTFDGEGLTVETFLLDPPPDTAPARIEVAFLTFVRPERKFESPELLKTQFCATWARRSGFTAGSNAFAWDRSGAWIIRVHPNLFILRRN